MIQVLNVINEKLQGMGINYEFMEWTTTVIYPYFVGEYEEIGSVNEDGMTESTFIITGTTRGSWLELEQAKDLMESHFDDLRIISPLGSGIVINFDRALPIPTGELDLKRIQINLQIKEWKVK